MGSDLLNTLPDMPQLKIETKLPKHLELLFEYGPAYWMVCIEPSGKMRTDGGHSTPAGVVKAKLLHESISVIKPPKGSKFYMVRVDEVPVRKVKVNKKAIKTLNEMAKAGRNLST